MMHFGKIIEPPFDYIVKLKDSTHTFLWHGRKYSLEVSLGIARDLFRTFIVIYLFTITSDPDIMEHNTSWPPFTKLNSSTLKFQRVQKPCLWPASSMDKLKRY